MKKHLGAFIRFLVSFALTGSTVTYPSSSYNADQAWCWPTKTK